MGETLKMTARMNLYYIDVPINLKLGYDLGPAKVFGLVGPYVGVGVSGKVKSKAEYAGETEEETEDICWGDDPENDDLKRLDYGVTFGAGAQISALEISLSYGLGLANIDSYTDEGNITRNKVISISLAYKIGR
jgi:hypothetical protein